MSDPDSRPRPRYGEYATPEQQRAAIKAPEANPHYAPPEPASAEHPSTALPPVRAHMDADERFGAPREPADGSSPNSSTLLRHPADRVVTIALLVFGLYNVISTVAGRGAIPDQIDKAYRSMGLAGDYAVTPLTGTVADVVSVVFLALWVAAAALSSWAILRGRIAFWIPLLAGIIASIVSAVGYLILFLHDPAFLAYMQHL